MKITIDDFFSKRFEEESNKILLEMPHFFSKKVMKEYVEQLVGIGLEEYIVYAETHPNLKSITTKDITQLSSIADCTIDMCSVWNEENDGKTLIQIAEALHGDRRYKDNHVALTKYGENQVKTACQLGLTVLRDNLWYLSSVGTIFPSLTDDVKYKFFSICMLRDPFYSRVICNMYRRETNLLDYMSILSGSTQKRRASSCMRLINIFVQQCKAESINIHPITVKFN